jgi:RNA polymerase sigma-70 factor, ECF subfamily
VEQEEVEQFSALFAAHFDDLWRFARRRCASGDAADDVVAQVFAVAWRRRADLPTSAERLWLFGVARHVLANDRRSSARQQRLHSKLTGVRAEAMSDAADVTASDAPIVPSLDVLSADERDAVQLRYWDDLSVGEIAELLGCSTNAVSLRLHRARRKLLGATVAGDPKDPTLDGHVVSEPDRRKEEPE